MHSQQGWKHRPQPGQTHNSPGPPRQAREANDGFWRPPGVWPNHARMGAACVGQLQTCQAFFRGWCRQSWPRLL